MAVEIFPVPVWALSYLINGDESGLEFGEKEMIDDWKQRNAILDVVCPDDVDDNSYFTHYPPFGLACNIVECECVLDN